MLQHLTKTALRFLWKYRKYNSLNLFGLSLAIGTSLLIFYYLKYEYDYDKYIPNVEDVYLVGEQRPNVDIVWYFSRALLWPGLQGDYPAIKNGTRIAYTYLDVNSEEERFMENGLFVDSTYLDVFGLKLIEGNDNNCLKRPDQVVLTTSSAEKYFPNESALGKTIQVGYENRIVSGIIADPPTNSSFTFQYLLTHEAREKIDDQQFINWYATTTFTALQLEKGADVEVLANEIDALVAEHTPHDIEDATFSLLPLTEYHLTVPGAKRELAIFWIIAFAILLIAGINFTNLHTAHSLNRRREIGVRKVLGATQSQLRLYFFGEAMLLSLFAGVLGMILADVLLPVFNQLLDVDLSIQYLSDIRYIVILFAITLGIGALAGLYPAWYLSRMQAVASLKGRLQYNMNANYFRNGLVSIQFMLSAMLIIGALVITKQVSFMQTKELNMDAKQVLAIRLNPDLFENPDQIKRKIPVLKEKLLQHPQIEKVGATQFAPYDFPYWGGLVKPEGQAEDIRMRFGAVDQAYFQVYGLAFLQGEGFSDARGSNSQAQIVINEAAKKAFGWEDPIGKYIEWGSGKYEIIGVLKDFHYASLEEPIMPLMYFYEGEASEYFKYLSVRFSGLAGSMLEYVHKQLAEIDPTYSFSTFFIDEHYQMMYEGVTRRARLTGILAGIAILIACLGLLGLVSFAAAKRTKEIGIRKVLGATISDILKLFMNSYLKLMGISLLFASPIAYILIQQWLQGFAYRISIGPFVFVVAAVISFMIAILTISFRVYKVARANPVDSLRDE